MIVFETANSKNDLEGILNLQRANLAENLTPQEIISQGFVTVKHTLDQLSKLNNTEKHIISKYSDKVVGYLLAMTQKAKNDIPVLVPMFSVFNETIFRGKRISDFNYIVVGQVCLDRSYRGQGILGKMYETYKEHFRAKYDFAITEIATTNTRSTNAHKKIGFKEVQIYKSIDFVEWSIVIWDWNE